MKPPKILAAASAIDLDFRYGCTPAWWQLWKGMYEAGVDLVVTPYRGRPVESPWWRVAPNPTFREGESYQVVRDVLARVKGDRYLRRAEANPDESAVDKLTRETIARWVTPRWKRHLERLIESERPDAVIVFTIPMAHLRGIPEALRERYGIPIVFYDGDVPMSLPEYGGMDTGFNPYHGADPWEYDLVVSNSEGGIPRLLELGARRAEALYWGADPEFFAPQDVEKEVDVFFYGYGDKFRRDWMKTMVGEPSRRDPGLDIALGGLDFQGDTGAARLLGDVPFNVFARAISAARVNLNMTRRPHATTRGSSTARPFELASSGAAIVSNPHDGIERWFEPGSELVVVETAEAALEAYRDLIADPAQAEGPGPSRARARPGRAHVCASGASALAARRSRRSGLGMSPPPLVAIVPAWNEAGAIGGVVDEVRSVGAEIEVVVVDDASRDETASIAEAHGATVLRLPFNVGIGGAVQTGFRYALEQGYERAVRLDGDGQHDASQIPRILAPIEAGEADLVIGSRFVDPTGLRPPLARRMGIRIFARLVSMLGRQRVTDTTSGFIALDRADRALRSRVPARLSRGGGDARRAPQRAPARPGAGRDARADAGTSSITFLRSLYYIVKVTLALFVASLRRYPKLEGAER